MRNQPYHSIAQETETSSGWDPHPQLRLWYLLGLIGVMLLGNVLRLGYIQYVIPERFDYAVDVPIQIEEQIPRRAGRILSREGLELAYDHEIYHLAVHYRWLEETPDPGWLKDQVRRRLTTSQRRNPELVAQVKEEIHQRRELLWKSIAKVTSLSPEKLQKERLAVVERVEKMKASIQKQHAGEETNTPSYRELIATNQIWDHVWKELTTPPKREVDARDLTLREELEYHRIVDYLPLEKVLQIESHPELFVGTRIGKDVERIYPHGDFASHVIGYRRPYQRPVDQAVKSAATTETTETKELNSLDAPIEQEWVGIAGLEASINSQISGTRGLRQITKSNKGEVLQEKIIKPMVPGEDITLTLHAGLQQRSEEIVDRLVTSPERYQLTEPTAANAEDPPPHPPASACLLAMDIRSGEILTAAVSPRPNSGLLAKGDGEYWQLLQQDPRKPLFPRMTHLEIPPGSVFKIASGIGLLEESIIKADEHFYCQGYLDRPDRNRCYVYRHFGVGHGEIDLREALSRSCNVYFFTAARKAGPEMMVDWYKRLGFGQPTGLEYATERSGRLPNPADRKHFVQGDTTGMSIGQSTLLVTPLQILRLMGVVGNNGRPVTPKLVLKTTTSPPAAESRLELASFEHEAEAPAAPLFSPQTVQEIKLAMLDCVENPRGTGYKTVRIPGVQIAGKTGTAETGRGYDHAWFAGFVPVDKPRIAFVVVLEEGGSGGADAGPVAKEFVQQMLDLNLISPTVKTAIKLNDD
jgi:penicillin-binding protein 2